MIRILHIDDKRDVSASLDSLLQEHHKDAVLKWFDNFEDGINSLREEPTKYNGVILDAKCFLNTEDRSLDEQFVIKAIKDIEEVFQSNNLWIPFCVLSGFKDEIDGYLKSHDITAFDKNADELNALNYILDNQKRVSRNLFLQEFPELKSFIEVDTLEKHTPNILLQIFGVLINRQKDSSIIKAQMAQIRPVLEKVLIKLYEFGEYEDELLIPEEYVSKSGSRIQINNQVGAFIYLNGDVAKGKKGNYQRNPVWPSYIGSQCMSIYNVTSTIGSHSNTDTGSLFTLKAMFYSLCDILLWFKSFTKNFN